MERPLVRFELGVCERRTGPGRQVCDRFLPHLPGKRHGHSCLEDRAGQIQYPGRAVISLHQDDLECSSHLPRPPVTRVHGGDELIPDLDPLRLAHVQECDVTQALELVNLSEAQNGGGDIRITKADGVTEVAREIVSCDVNTLGSYASDANPSQVLQ